LFKKNMCGISGSTIPNDDSINKMVESIKHRGPDNVSVWSNKFVTFGHARLSIIDTSNAGNQPFTVNIDGEEHTIVFNGEIYNYETLQKEFNHEWKSQSDTELLIVGLAKQGIKFLEKCHGMWSFAWYHKNKVVLCRDRFGQKPLYYTNTDHLRFSSELQSLLPFTDKKVDKKALNEYLTYRFVTAPLTIVEGIFKLDAGEYVEYNIKTKKFDISKYYNLMYKPTGKKYQTKIEDLHGNIAKSVSLRLRSDVDVGSFLSGGWDSSIITSLAATESLHTYSMGFDTTNELPYAENLAKYLGTKHHPVMLHDSDAFNIIPEVISMMDEPVGDPGFVPVYLLCKHAHTKVILTGDGADELYAGYDRYKLWAYGHYLKHFALIKHRYPIYKKLRDLRGKKGFEAFHSIISVFSDNELKLIGVQPVRLTEYWEEGIPPLFQAQLFDIRTLLPNDFFMKSDKMGGAHGKELRTPFFDHKVVEHAFTLKEKDVLKHYTEKRILKDCFSAELPQVITKHRKHGFNVPIDQWFKQELGQELHLLLDEQTVIKKEYIKKLLEKPLNNNYKNNFVNAQKLWTVYVLLSWMKHHKVL